MFRSKAPAGTKRRSPTYSGPQWQAVALVLAAAVLAQATVLHFVAFRGVTPSLVLVAVVWYAIRVDLRRAVLYGLIAGVFEDVLAAQTGGAWTIATTVTAAFTSLISRGFFADSIPLVSLVTIVATFVRALAFWTVMSLEGYPAGMAGIHLHQTLWEAVFNVGVMIVAMLVVRARTA